MSREGWRPALLHGLPVAGVVLALFYHWFAVADRYTVFLYYHDMGPVVPDTSPFSPVTSSRYWMAGIVAGGLAMVLYAGGNWLIARIRREYRPPSWRRVWAVCAGALIVGVPAITMTVNDPTLPPVNALQTTLAALVGVWLAVVPGEMATRRPRELIALSIDGAAMAAVTLGLSMLERVAWYLEHGSRLPLLTVAVGLTGAAVWLLGMTAVRAWQRWPVPSARALFVAGLCVAYPLMTLVHHVSFTDGYYYITNSDNYLSRSWGLQIAAWLATAALAAGVTRLRRRLAATRAEAPRGAA